ncbi:MAG: MBL fold metallo-hydrolase [Bdellovibrionota bacterium]
MFQKENEKYFRNEVIEQYEIGEHKNFVYLILDKSSRSCAIVDPQEDLTEPLSALEKNGFDLTHILITHTHFDHIAGLGELLECFHKIKFVIHQRELHRLSKNILNDKRLIAITGDETINVGSFDVMTIHTPGHSAGECCYLVPNEPAFLFTGDTVFIGDCGRTDLDTGSTQEMFRSIQKLKALPPDTIILPGHHYSLECVSTIKREIATSAPFKCTSASELERLP